MPVLEVDAFSPDEERNLVGPIIRSGDVADAVIDAVEADNPSRDVYVLDRDDYVRIHTPTECVLSLASIQSQLGADYDLAMLEIQMPSFKGRMETRTDRYRWYYETTE